MCSHASHWSTMSSFCGTTVDCILCIVYNPNKPKRSKSICWKSTQMFSNVALITLCGYVYLRRNTRIYKANQQILESARGQPDIHLMNIHFGHLTSNHRGQLDFRLMNDHLGLLVKDQLGHLAKDQLSHLVNYHLTNYHIGHLANDHLGHPVNDHLVNDHLVEDHLGLLANDHLGHPVNYHLMDHCLTCHRLMMAFGPQKSTSVYMLLHEPDAFSFHLNLPVMWIFKSSKIYTFCFTYAESQKGFSRILAVPYCNNLWRNYYLEIRQSLHFSPDYCLCTNSRTRKHGISIFLFKCCHYCFARQQRRSKPRDILMDCITVEAVDSVLYPDNYLQSSDGHVAQI